MHDDTASPSRALVWAWVGIFVLPVIGSCIALVYASKLRSAHDDARRATRIAAIGLLLWSAIILAAAVDRGDHSDTADSSSAQHESVEVAITEILEDGPLGGTTSFGSRQPRLQYVEAIPTPTGATELRVQVNADDHLTPGLRRKFAYLDLAAATQAIFTADLEIRLATFEVFFPTIDEYGHERSALVYECEIDEDTAAKIEFKNRDLIDWTRVWTEIYNDEDW